MSKFFKKQKKTTKMRKIEARGAATDDAISTCVAADIHNNNSVDRAPTYCAFIDFITAYLSTNTDRLALLLYKHSTNPPTEPFCPKGHNFWLVLKLKGVVVFFVTVSRFFRCIRLYFELVPDLTKSSLENRQVASSPTHHFLAISRAPPEKLNEFCLKTKFSGG